MTKYTLGLDFGTLSVRAAIVNVENGDVISTNAVNYKHGVLEESLPNGVKLGTDWALQIAEDYYSAMVEVVKTAMENSELAKEQIIGIGTDFTSSTILPIFADGRPLNQDPRFKDNPHSYVKLWKHHAAEPYAKRINEKINYEGLDILNRYGGQISSEWQIPKVWQIMEESPEIYNACDYIIEAGDWITLILTGNLTKNACAAGFKGNWNDKEGYPSQEFLKSLHPLFENYVLEKLNYPILYPGNVSGYLTEDMASKLNLQSGIPVSASIIDAMASFPATSITEPNKMQAAIGTSTCQILLSKEEINVPGITGLVYGGVYPNMFSYESGQAAVGDIFAWFADRFLSREYELEAEKQGLSKHEYLNLRASQLQPGESGLVALDWWNGNRSILSDYDLSGMLVGLTLSTRPEEIYRALIEATAYSTKLIIENFRKNGIEVNEYIAAGGISQKSPLTMQIYADVLNMPISVAGVEEGGAVGSACYGAIAAGSKLGGYDSIEEAAEKMGSLKTDAYIPNQKSVEVYEKLYNIYLDLHDYFGKINKDVMYKLKNIKIKNSDDY